MKLVEKKEGGIILYIMTNTASLLMMKSLKEMEDRILFYREKREKLMLCACLLCISKRIFISVFSA